MHNVIAELHIEWQRAVSDYEEMMRDARFARLCYAEMEELSRPYTLRIDVAFARLRRAEAAARQALPPCSIFNTPATNPSV